MTCLFKISTATIQNKYKWKLFHVSFDNIIGAMNRYFYVNLAKPMIFVVANLSYFLDKESTRIHKRKKKDKNQEYKLWDR